MNSLQKQIHLCGKKEITSRGDKPDETDDKPVIQKRLLVQLFKYCFKIITFKVILNITLKKTQLFKHKYSFFLESINNSTVGLKAATN